MIPGLDGATKAQRRAMLRQLEQDNKNYPLYLIPVSTEGTRRPPRLMAALRSRHFLVQIYNEGGGYVRMSVNRTEVDEKTLRWREDISWDDMQRLKSEAGYGARDAVEVYPPDSDVVNVANMRHLWIMPEPLPFVWRRLPAVE